MTEKRDRNTTNLREKKKLPEETSTNSGAEAKRISMHDLVGEKLRAYYDQVASEPVPDRFEQLLKQLEAKSKKEKSG
jgi:Anti-sigma factor NepR